MALRKSAEQKAAAAEEKQLKNVRKQEEKRKRALDGMVQQFWESPAGKARVAFDAGDQVFQYSIDVMNQQAIIVAMIGSGTTSKKMDPTAVLNSVCHEGWEIVNGDFVFVMTGQQSRDKFLSSGQNVAVAGTVVAYYLFKRCESNRRPETESQLLDRLRTSIR